MARRASKGSDPLLSGADWVKVKAYWRAGSAPCARCGGAIDRTSPRYWPGTHRVNPATLVVGHIVSRDTAKQLGWTRAQINALSNTQPEHARCSDSSGATDGNRKRAQARTRSVVQALVKPVTSRRW